VVRGLKVTTTYLFHSLPVPYYQIDSVLQLMLFMLEPVVTVDGILLTKSGTMTGGTSGGMEARSNKWDDKKIEGWFICIVFM
jgi:hypothetical protein